jgi:hypothetical protein
MYTPIMNGLLHCLFRLVTDRRCEVDEVLSIFILGPSWPKGIPQKIELCFRIVAWPVVGLAIDNPVLVGWSSSPHSLQTAAVCHSIISVTKVPMAYPIEKLAK